MIKHQVISVCFYIRDRMQKDFSVYPEGFNELLLASLTGIALWKQVPSAKDLKKGK